jgi:hypothetical protein
MHALSLLPAPSLAFPVARIENLPTLVLFGQSDNHGCAKKGIQAQRLHLVANHIYIFSIPHTLQRSL